MTAPAEQYWLQGFPVVNGVHLLEPPSDFEQVYGAVRNSEGRLLTDDQVRHLPGGAGLPHAQEWAIRKSSTERLLQALHRRVPHGRILEVGCGNGWLSARLQAAGHRVVGIDPFTAELEQAARVFPDGPVYVRAQPFTAALPEDHFDAVVFAASIQYFADATGVLRRALRMVRPGGQGHVVDTILYPDAVAAGDAAQRSNDYFTRIGHHAMIGRYHAHQREQLLTLPGAQVLARPTVLPWLRSFFGKASSPFTHVVLTRP